MLTVDAVIFALTPSNKSEINSVVNFLLIKNEVKATALLAGPIIASSLVQVIIGFVDVIMLGRYHPEHLAAGALSASLWVFVMLAGMGFSMGISVLVAQLAGAGKVDKIGPIFQQSIWLCAALSLIIFIVLQTIGNILPWFEVDPVLVPLTKSYLSIIAWGMIFSQLYLAGRFLSEGIEYSRPMMIIQLTLLPINAFGNYLLIFGNWGFPELGVTGAAISTSISLVLGCILMFANLFYNKRYKALHLFSNFQSPRVKLIKQILIISIPVAISIMLETGLFSAVALLMARLGTIPIAGHQIAIIYAELMFMVPLGFSMAATVRVGNAIGREDYLDAKRRGWVAIAMAGVFMLFSATILFLFNQQIASIFTNNKQVIVVAANLMIFAGIFQISDGLQISSTGALRGYKDTKIPMYFNLLGYWIIGFPSAYYLAFQRQYLAQGLWSGLIIGLTVVAVLSMLRYKSISNRRISSGSVE